MIEWSLFAESWPSYAAGLWLTLQLTALSLIVGLVLAVPLAVLRVSPNRWVSGPVWAYSYFFRGTPMLVQLLLMYYGLGQFEWIRAQWDDGNPFWLVLADVEGRSAIDWGIYGAPETFLVDRNGVIQWKHIGPLTDEIIAKELMPALQKSEGAR